MTKSFKQKQYKHQHKVSQAHPEWFGNDKCWGVFRRNKYQFVLKDCMNNLYSGLRTKEKESPMNVLRYFKENGIGWWSGAKPSAHMCSSQIACVNHLFPIRYDHTAVLALANSAAKEAGEQPFDEVIEIGGDKCMSGYIAFEVITSTDYLNEAKDGTLSRGSQCTSVDAAILAKRGNDIFILPIEWKFVEEYNRNDKSRNYYDKKGNCHCSGDKRIRNYFESGLVTNSTQIKYNSDQDPHGSVFFQEPFYQLMRQTLWAEQLIKNKDSLFFGAVDYIHVNVVPKANTTLRDRVYRKVSWDTGKGMIDTWKANLTNPDKYLCIDPKVLFSGIRNDKSLSEKYTDLLSYLEARYW